MKRLPALSFIALCALTSGCTSQAEKDDIADICFSPERSGATGEKDTSARAMKIADYLKKTLRTETWRTFFKQASTMSEGKRTLTLRRAADDAGLKSCPLLDNP